MSNLIVPLQRYLLGSSSFVPPNLRLEFTERIGNLCAYSGQPMSPQLRTWVERTFGLEMIRVIQDYSTYTSSRVSDSLQNTIKRVIPKTINGTESYLEFVRLFDSECGGCTANSFYVADFNGLFGSPQGSYRIKTPDAVQHNITIPSDVIAVQGSGYQLLSATSNLLNPSIFEIHFYGDPSDASGWEIYDPNAGSFVPLVWRLEDSVCAELQCLEYSFTVEEITYPGAQVYAINDPSPDINNTPLAISIPLFAIPDAQFEQELAELIQSMFGKNVTCEKDYDGTTFTIRLYSVQSILTTPTPHPEFVKILIDLEPGAGNYEYLEPTIIECP